MPDTRTYVGTLTSFEARRAVDFAVQEASRDGDKPIAIAILDTSGLLVEFHAMEGVLPGSRELAIPKARTALFFASDTLDREKRLKDEPHMPSAYPSHLGLCFYGGGVVLRADKGNPVFGAIGISGRKSYLSEKMWQDGITAPQDHELAVKVRDWFWDVTGGEW